MPEPLSSPPLEADFIAVRRERILIAAGELFGAYGYRRMTMEAAAEAAQIAKATLYSYYRNKEVLFAAVVSHLADGLVREFQGALIGTSPVVGRVHAALVGKSVYMFQAVRGLPHAQELFSETDQLARNVFEAADRQMVVALGAALAEDPAFAARSLGHARALFFGAHGVAFSCADLPTLLDEVGQFIGIYLAGARTGPR